MSNIDPSAPKTGAAGKFFVSPHAVTQYIARARPTIPRGEALLELIRLSSAAVRLRCYLDGRELWRGPNKDVVPRLLFIVGPTSEGVLPVIETIPVRRLAAPSPNNHKARARAKRATAYRASFAEAVGEPAEGPS